MVETSFGIGELVYFVGYAILRKIDGRGIWRGFSLTSASEIVGRVSGELGFIQRIPHIAAVLLRFHAAARSHALYEFVSQFSILWVIAIFFWEFCDCHC